MLIAADEDLSFRALSLGGTCECLWKETCPSVSSGLTSFFLLPYQLTGQGTQSQTSESLLI